MSESTTTSQEGSTTEPKGEGAAGAASENQPAGGSPKTFTQDEVNSLLAREKREQQAKYSDYEEFKAKAAKYDELEEAKKSELEKAQEATAKAMDDVKSWQAKYDELKEQIERREAIDEAAAKYKVDAAMLARMSGDVEDNAKFLAEKAAGASKYPSVKDSGESRPQSRSLDEIRAIKDPVQRVKARAEYMANDN